MGNFKKQIHAKLIYTILGIAAVAGLAAIAGCSHQTTTTSTAPPPLESASGTVQPYTVVDQLPPKPATNEHRRRALHLVHHDGQLVLADAEDHYYDCGRDAQGNLYPTFYDRYTRQWCPLYYDADRDGYYCAVERDGRYYREYWDDPSRLYYDNYIDYADYYPPAEYRPVIYVESTYYHPSYYSHHARPDWLLALPVVAVAFISLSNHDHHGYYGNNGYVAQNPPIYRNGRGGPAYNGAPFYRGGGPGFGGRPGVAARPPAPGPAGFGRPGPGGQVANAPTQGRPFGYPAGRAPHPAAHPIPGRPAGQVAARPNFGRPAGQIAARPAPRPAAIRRGEGRQVLAHRQAVPPGTRIPLGAQQARRPAIRAARPAPRPAPRAMVHVVRPGRRPMARVVRPAPRAVVRAPRPAPRPTYHAARPAGRPGFGRPIRSPMPPHPAARNVARPFQPGPRPAPPAYHRTFAPQGPRPGPPAGARPGPRPGFGRPRGGGGRPAGPPQARPQPRAAGGPPQGGHRGGGPQRRRPGGQ